MRERIKAELLAGRPPAASEYQARDAAMLQLSDSQLQREYARQTELYLDEGTPPALRGMAEMLVIKLGELTARASPQKASTAGGSSMMVPTPFLGGSPTGLQPAPRTVTSGALAAGGVPPDSAGGAQVDMGAVVEGAQVAVRLKGQVVAATVEKRVGMRLRIMHEKHSTWAEMRDVLALVGGDDDDDDEDEDDLRIADDDIPSETPNASERISNHVAGDDDDDDLRIAD